MRELGIEIITPNNPHISNSDLVNSQKSIKKGIKIKNLKGLKFISNHCLFLRYRDGYFNIEFNFIISQNKDNGGIPS